MPNKRRRFHASKEYTTRVNRLYDSFELHECFTDDCPRLHFYPINNEDAAVLFALINANRPSVTDEP